MTAAVVDRIVGISVIVLSLWLYRYSSDFPLQAEIYPQFVLKVMIALSALIIAASFRAGRADSGEKKEADKARTSESVRPLVAFAVIALYVYLIRPLGFFASSALFLCALTFYLGTRRPATFVYVVLGVLALVYIVFAKQLHVPLPSGILL